jgi:hypothetical protein
MTSGPFFMGWALVIAGLVLCAVAIGMVGGPPAVLGFCGGMAALGGIGLILSTAPPRRMDEHIE